MQTFLPYPSFEQSARVLDYKRLGKQRVEGAQIINTLEGRSTGWANHPCVRMWDGYVDALKVYTNTMILEWTHRRYKNNMELYVVEGDYEMPFWFGWNVVHRSHRASLLSKAYGYYIQYGWTELPINNIYWPV